MKHSRAPWTLRARNARLPGERDEHVVALDVMSGGRVIGSATIREDLPYERNAAVMVSAPTLLAIVEEVAEADCADVIPGRPGCGECTQCRARAIVARIGGAA